MYANYCVLLQKVASEWNLLRVAVAFTLSTFGFSC